MDKVTSADGGEASASTSPKKTGFIILGILLALGVLAGIYFFVLRPNCKGPDAVQSGFFACKCKEGGDPHRKLDDNDKTSCVCEAPYTAGKDGHCSQPCSKDTDCSNVNPSTTCGTDGVCVSCGAAPGQLCCGTTTANDTTPPCDIGMICEKATKTCASCGSKVGMPCCDGGKCSQGLVCDPVGTGLCISCGNGANEPCCPPDDSCQHGFQCDKSAKPPTCIACGTVGNPCCEDPASKLNVVCLDGAKCAVSAGCVKDCGNTNDNCCLDSKGNKTCKSASDQCDRTDGTCRPYSQCGAASQNCCPGDKCNDSTLACDLPSGKCVDCGIPPLVCCPGQKCSPGSDCGPLGHCYTCGKQGQPCCNGSCGSSLVCTVNGLCEAHCGQGVGDLCCGDPPACKAPAQCNLGTSKCE